MTTVDHYGHALRVVRHEMPNYESARTGRPVVERREFRHFGPGAFVTVVPVPKRQALSLAVDCREAEAAGDVLAWDVATPAEFWQAIAAMHEHIEASAVERVCVVLDEELPALLPAAVYLALCPVARPGQLGA